MFQDYTFLSILSGILVPQKTPEECIADNQD